MLFDTPLRAEHSAFASLDAARRTERAQQARGAVAARRAVEIEYLPFGPADEHGAPTCEVVAAYAEVELEYAAMRSACALIDCAERATLVIKGRDRVDFLNRLVTQELRTLVEGGVTRAFLTNRKGRIEADLVIAALPDALLIDTLVHDVAPVQAALTKMLFAEDVVITSRVETHARLALHGPRAVAALRALGLASENAGENPGENPAANAWSSALGDAIVDIIRIDDFGFNPAHAAVETDQRDLGFALSVPRARIAELWRSFVTFGARPAGWFATNTARIEAGTPYFRIDFGPTNLPAESGVLNSRVSFTKGCYPGQEVVARMQHLGKPKQKLIGLRVEGDLLPVSDAQVFAIAEGTSIGRQMGHQLGDQLGVITSSGLAPMLGAVPVAFAMISSRAYEIGTKVLVNAEGEQAIATVTPLAFLTHAQESAAVSTTKSTEVDS